MRLCFFVLAVFTLYALLRLQQGKNKFDFKDILMDPRSGYTHASSDRFFLFGAFCASTWVLIVQTDKGQLAEWYFNGYMVTWCGSRLISKYLERGQTLPAPTQQKVEVSAPADASVTVSTGDPK